TILLRSFASHTIHSLPEVSWWGLSAGKKAYILHLWRVAKRFRQESLNHHVDADSEQPKKKSKKERRTEKKDSFDDMEQTVASKIFNKESRGRAPRTMPHQKTTTPNSRQQYAWANHSSSLRISPPIFRVKRVEGGAHHRSAAATLPLRLPISETASPLYSLPLPAPVDNSGSHLGAILAQMKRNSDQLRFEREEAGRRRKEDTSIRGEVAVLKKAMHKAELAAKEWMYRG
ncbi:hypothetical protein BDK51DRAFT_30495, partial [Blyttiomyces helicus]